ncbi:MAG TPA: HK97 gp10 family phage protein [Pirellulales bacterium]|nr:HK97 gp10 family phage protein [Pirellulales bacterium]
MSLFVKGDKELIRKLQQLERAVATEILREELKTTAKQVVEIIKPTIPVGETKFLRRSLQVKPIKKKKRFTHGYRIASKVPTIGKGKDKRKGKYYAFAPEYGVRVARGKQRARRFMARGIKQAERLLPDTKARIWARIQAEWRK